MDMTTFLLYLAGFSYLCLSAPMMPVPEELSPRQVNAVYKHFVDSVSDEEILGE